MPRSKPSGPVKPQSQPGPYSDHHREPGATPTNPGGSPIRTPNTAPVEIVDAPTHLRLPQPEPWARLQISTGAVISDAQDADECCEIATHKVGQSASSRYQEGLGNGRRLSRQSDILTHKERDIVFSDGVMTKEPRGRPQFFTPGATSFRTDAQTYV